MENLTTNRPDEYVGEIAIDHCLSLPDSKFRQFLDKHFSQNDFKAARLYCSNGRKFTVKILFSDDTVEETECGVEEFFNSFIMTAIRFCPIHDKGNIDWDLLDQ